MAFYDDPLASCIDALRCIAAVVPAAQHWLVGGANTACFGALQAASRNDQFAPLFSILD